MASTGITALDKLLGPEGYPERSAVLVTGAPGVGKQALGYSFIHSGLDQGDFCLYVTRLATREVLKDAKAFGVNFENKAPSWISSDGAGFRYDYRDLTGLSYSIKEVLKKNSERRIRVFADVFSPLLMLNPPDAIYKFLTQLIADVKQYDSVMLATLEDGMHETQVMTAMEALFDGVIELKVYREGGLSYVPILTIQKMLGMPPQPGYFRFSFSQNAMEVAAYAQRT
ncbi:MAG: RAD55 family ATPase [Thaumarchaeota archaeon]|nr:RAD55 family ATPase [Nitrososphaerota archaeon]